MARHEVGCEPRRFVWGFGEREGEMRCRGENLLLPLPGHEVGCEPCRFVWGFGKERERGVIGEKISFFPCLCTSRGRRRCIVSFKTTPFSLFFVNSG